MRALAAAYAVLALLATPALLWAADAPPPAATTTTPAPTEATTTATAPAPVPAPAPPAQDKAAQPEEEEVVERDAAPEPVARTAASGGVTIEDFAYSPKTITVDQGDTVTWTNRDGVGHSATADDGSFDTGIFNRGETASQQFDEAGTFAYHCTPHPNMTATVVVRASSTGAADGDDSADTAGTTSATPDTGTATSSGTTLPATGLRVGIVFLGGVLLLAGGALLRRRVRA